MTDAAWLTLQNPQYTTIHAGSAYLTFGADGRVWASPDLQPDDAARAVIKCMVDAGWLRYAIDRPAAEQHIVAILTEQSDPKWAAKLIVDYFGEVRS